MRDFLPWLLRLLSVAGIILGLTATHASAEKIQFSFRSSAEADIWFEASGNWTIRNGRYIGRPGRDPSARTLYSDNDAGRLSDFRGFVSMTVPKDGTAFVLVRAVGQRGYLLGLLNRLGNTHLRVVKRNADGETTVLCNKLIRPPPTGFQRVGIFVSGSQLSVSTSDAGCRGFDRSFAEGRFGLETQGGGKNSFFKVETVDVVAKR